MMDEINERHGIYPPSELTVDRESILWPLLWGDAPACGDDPCDDLPHLTLAHLIVRVRTERAPKPEFTTVKWIPAQVIAR